MTNFLEFEIESKKNENKLSNLIQTKAKELDYIKRANQGDLNALKRVIRTIGIALNIKYIAYSQFIRRYNEETTDANKRLK